MLGLLALGLGTVCATDYGAIMTRLHARQVSDRMRLPPLLRRLTLPPTHPSAHRVPGALLAGVGCVFVASGVWVLIP
ncbi:hypothetical protein [Streptacidiphilus sp. MAP12-33]|uniref:hypothetical protein n=1 Tax=Streptacidiphilus sp. MAP12-33 TaxID=3156266 RepID=UPI0035187A70